MNTPIAMRRLFALIALFALTADISKAQRGGGGGGGGGGFGGGGGGKGGGGGGGAQGGDDQQQKAPTPQATPKYSVATVYPYDFALAGTEGTAELTYDVDDKGVPHNIKVTRASKPEFGKSISAALEETMFTPPDKDGKAQAVKGQSIKFAFTKLMIDQALVDELKKTAPEIIGPSEVDGGLKPLRLNEPVYPEMLAKAKAGEGKAQIEFLIDKDGTVHMPKIISSTKDEFGWSAASAVLVWRFAPPTKGGKPVIVRVSAPVSFKAPADPAAAAKK